jgi:hypothetical protein
MRKSFLLAAAALLAAPVAVVACSSTSSDLGAGDDSTQTGGDASSGGDSAVGTGDTGTTPTPDSGGDLDAGVDTGIPSCAGLTYCDDFEAYLDADVDGGVENNKMLGVWKISIGGKAKMKVDTVKPFSGLRSLHITTPANDTTESNGTLHQAAASGGLVTGNDVFGRAMVYYSNVGGNGLPQGHSWVFQSQGTSTKEAANVSMNVANSGGNYFLNYHSATNPEQSVSGGTPAAGKWLCMQWEYNGSGTTPADEGKIWIDGTVVVDAKAQTPNWDFATPWSNFDFGFTHYQTIANSMDVYLDDFALDSKMIPCPPPKP